jgi:hypothetical protein
MKRKWMSSAVALALVAIAFGVLPVPRALAATTVVNWSFDAGNLTPSVGAGTIFRGAGLQANATEYPTGNPTSGLAWNNQDFTANGTLQTAIAADEFIGVQVDLTNCASLTVSFDERASSTGPKNYEIYYSTDGSNFSTTGAAGVINMAFGATPMHAHSFPYDSVVDQVIRDQSNVYFRIYAWGATSTSGTWRLDNVSVSSSSTPSAVTLRTLSATSRSTATGAVASMAVLGGLAALMRRRKA